METTSRTFAFDTTKRGDPLPRAITILVVLNLLGMVFLAWQWFQLSTALGQLSSYEQYTMSDSLPPQSRFTCGACQSPSSSRVC